MSYHDAYNIHTDMNRPVPKIKTKTLKLELKENFGTVDKHEINMLDSKGSLKNPQQIIKEVMLFLEGIK